MKHFVTDREFRQLPADEAEQVLLCKQFLPVIKAEGERTIKFVISTEEVDRVHDTIAAAGWELENYRKNPVVLWAHDRWALPIAKSLKVAIENNQLVSVAEFATHDFAQEVFDLVMGGFLNATSVGMRPIEYAYVEDTDRPYGIDFKRQELLEYSVVPVPANPDALVAAKAAGHNIEPLMRWAKDLLAARPPEPSPQGRKLRALWTPKAGVNR